ncbi:MAG: sigma-70 family RNA polymerase sigma factor [Ardenticatenaceae bacterium]|nr:sigma-70 family RNA polymerase sigma factor [Ardenticatenaceae bacterium]
METYVNWVWKTADNQLPTTERHQAFGELVHLFQDMAYSVANSILDDFHLAQDAVQESFVTAYKQLPQLLDPQAFPGWFKQIVISQCYRAIRHKQPTHSLEITADLISNEPDPALAVEDFELKDKVLTALQDLPEREQIVTKLFYLNGYSQNEIAKLLQIPVTTVKKRLQYARQHLRGVLATMFDVVTPAPTPVPIPIPRRRRLPRYPEEYERPYS